MNHKQLVDELIDEEEKVTFEQRFVERVENSEVLALIGDVSYDDFCRAVVILAMSSECYIFSEVMSRSFAYYWRNFQETVRVLKS